MIERDLPRTDRKSISKRQLAADALWDIDSNSHCHDMPPSSQFVAEPVATNNDTYVVSLDTETGEVTIIADEV